MRVSCQTSAGVWFQLSQPASHILKNSRVLCQMGPNILASGFRRLEACVFFGGTVPPQRIRRPPDAGQTWRPRAAQEALRGDRAPRREAPGGQRQAARRKGLEVLGLAPPKLPPFAYIYIYIHIYTHRKGVGVLWVRNDWAPFGPIFFSALGF